MKSVMILAAVLAVGSAGQMYSEQGNYQNAEAYQHETGYRHEAVADGHGMAAPHAAYTNRPVGERNAKIISYHSENNVANYKYGYETENGIKAEEVGQTPKGTRAEGAYSYKGGDGNVYTVTYIADENGFRAQGAHIPTPPPINEDILKSLEQNAKDEANGIYDDGQYKEPNQGQAYRKYEGAVYQQSYPSANAQGAAVENFYH